jgi:hypothetical protein
MPRAPLGTFGRADHSDHAFLLLSGLLNGEVGESPHDPSSRPQPGEVPPAVRDGGPIIDPVTPEATTAIVVLSSCCTTAAGIARRLLPRSTN